MALAHHADIAFIEQPARMQIGGRALRRNQRQIDIAALQSLVQRQMLGRHHSHAHTGRALAQHGQKRQHHRLQRVIRGGNAQRHMCRSRIKGLGTQQRFGIAQQFLERPGQCQRAQRGGDAALRAHEQGIVEALAQSRQHAADRRLGQRQTLGSARHAALVQQRIQGLEQIQVQTLDISRHDFTNQKYRLDLFHHRPHHFPIPFDRSPACTAFTGPPTTCRAPPKTSSSASSLPRAFIRRFPSLAVPDFLIAASAFIHWNSV
ncbi:hypothetical protein SDC9_139201 [bioreactor metagenome]|uniref:Uncharacterized protein n=1 Tax=bioreactor metagenome TaxID=1076179 RepID=A0A645DRV7_9ZZZZ